MCIRGCSAPCTWTHWRARWCAQAGSLHGAWESGAGGVQHAHSCNGGVNKFLLIHRYLGQHSWALHWLRGLPVVSVVSSPIACCWDNNGERREQTIAQPAAQLEPRLPSCQRRATDHSILPGPAGVHSRSPSGGLDIRWRLVGASAVHLTCVAAHPGLAEVILENFACPDSADESTTRPMQALLKAGGGRLASNQGHAHLAALQH